MIDEPRLTDKELDELESAYELSIAPPGDIAEVDLDRATDTITSKRLYRKVPGVVREVRRLRARDPIETLSAWLHHKAECTFVREFPKRCSCGLDAALAKVAKP